MDKNKTIMENWKIYGNPFLDFNEEITQEWMNKEFNKEECKSWLDIGLRANDFDFACWLKNSKSKNAEWVLNQGKVEELRQEYQQNTRERERERESSL